MHGDRFSFRGSLGFSILLLAGALASCLGGGGRIVSGVGQNCESDTSCDDGLFCSAAGALGGLCTEECDGTQVCEAKYGEFAFCADGLCALMCGTDEHCLGDTACTGLLQGEKFCRAAHGASGDAYGDGG